MANRGLSLNGVTFRGGLYQNPHANEPVDIDAANREFLRTLASAPLDLRPLDSDPPEVKEAKLKAHQLLKDALDGSRQALRSLNAIRLEQVDNYIKATSYFMSFFTITTLKDDEQPYVQNITQNEIRISFLSQDGRPRMIKIEKDMAEQPIELRYLSSAKVGYRTEDIYKGRIAEVAQKTFDIGFDLKNQMDAECYKLLNLPVAQGGAYGTFTFDGNKATRIYVPHSRIITAHLPASNDITVYRRNASGDYVDANGNVVATNSPNKVIVGKFGIAVLQEIIRYCDSWGDVFSDGRLRPTGEILVPSSDIFDILFSLAPGTTNVNETKIQEDITTKGYTGFTYAGIDWKFVPDVTIPSGKCFPKLNKLPGRVFLKPGLDKEFVETDLAQSWEDRFQKKVFGVCIINQKRINTLRLTYK